jgi:hypothetical protein
MASPEGAWPSSGTALWGHGAARLAMTVVFCGLGHSAGPSNALHGAPLAFCHPRMGEKHGKKLKYVQNPTGKWRIS